MTSARAVAVRALLGALLLSFGMGGVGCTCGGDARRDRHDETAPRQRTVWLKACIPSPQRIWDDFKVLSGSGLRKARLPATLDQLAAHLSDLPLERVKGAIDWQSPVLVVIFESKEGRPGREAFALKARPAASSQTELSLDDVIGPRELRTRGGQRLYVEAARDALYVAPSEWALAAMSDYRGEECRAEREAIEVGVTRALLGSRQVVSWVEMRGARLEASAREATARRGRPTLGDPEALARMLARWAEDTRSRAEEAAPLRVTLSTSTEMLELSVEGRRRRKGTPPSGRSAGDLLRAIAPDAYLALASEATGGERRRRARDVVGVLAGIAGDRMPPTEREELDAAFAKLASALDGQMALALRPALDPGPLVGLGVLECRDSNEAAIALDDAAGYVARGSLQNILDHLGAHLEPGERRREADEGERTFIVSAPEDVDEERGQIVRRLTGARPTLAWKRHDSRLLVALGPEPHPELVRLAEAVSSQVGASVLTQPVLSRAAGRRPRPSLLAFGWLPSIAGLLTQGGPGAGRLPPGGVGLAAGDLDADAEGWHATLLLDGEQLRSVLPWLTGRGDR